MLAYMNLLLLINAVQTNFQGNCYLEGVTPSHWLTTYTNTPVKDSKRKEFKQFLTKNINTVRVQGVDYGKYFEAQLHGGYLLIAPTAAFENFEQNENSSLNPTINVDLHFECANSLPRKLTFCQPIIDTNTYAPKFTKSLYIYKLAMPLSRDLKLNIFGDTITACDFDISNDRLEFTINPPEKLSITWKSTTNKTDKCHVAVVKTSHWLRLTSNQDYEIGVTDMGSPPKSSIATLRIEIDAQNSLPPNPHFESAYYAATYFTDKDRHDFKVNGFIKLRGGFSKLKLNLVGEYKDKFSIEEVSDRVIVKLKENLSKEVLASSAVVLIAIEATVENAEESGRSVLVIYLPKTDCPGNVKSKPVLIASIRFQKDNYWFQSSNWYHGFLGFVKVIVDPEQEVKYTFQTLDGSNIPHQLQYSETTGMITLTEQLDVGIYNIIAVAEAVTSEIKTQTSIVINIYHSYELSHPLHSIEVHHITENSEGHIQLCTNFALGCKYEVIEQYPETDPPLFQIAKDTLHHGAINRQMKIFDDMEEPQIAVRLNFEEVSSSTDFQSKRTTMGINETRHWALLPAKNVYEANQLLMIVHINDVNDNPPIFEYGEKLVVGYPDKELVAYLAPPFLTRVYATDLDVGMNADIRYTTNSTHFAIHPKTGIVYPKEDAFSDNLYLNFIVMATDRDGDVTYGLSTSIQIKIKLLQEVHLTVLTIKNMMLEDLNSILKALSNDVNLKIKYLRAAVVPSSKEEFFESTLIPNGSANIHIFLKATVYALDEEDRPVQGYQLRHLLKLSTIIDDFTVDKWEIPSGRNTKRSTRKSSKCRTFSTTKYIFTIIILTIFLILIMTVSAGYFYRTYRLKNLATQTNLSKEKKRQSKPGASKPTKEN